MKVIMYTTHCPQCKVLEKMLNDKKIEYTQITDIDIMKSKGIQSVPYLEVEGVLKNFKESMEWIRNAN